MTGVQTCALPIYNASQEFGDAGNLVMGANVAGFLKVADAMKWQGVAY